MPQNEFPRGIYLVSRAMQGKPGGEHFAVIFYGEWPLNRHENGSYYPVIAELSPPRISMAWYEGGWWTIHHRVPAEKEADAVARLEQMCANNPDYALLARNCEQFARWVTTGIWESKQVQTVGAIATMAAIWLMVAGAEVPNRSARYRNARRAMAKVKRRYAA